MTNASYEEMDRAIQIETMHEHVETQMALVAEGQRTIARDPPLQGPLPMGEWDRIAVEQSAASFDRDEVRPTQIKEFFDLQITLSSDIYDRFRALAKRLGLTPEHVLLQSVADFLSAQERGLFFERAIKAGELLAESHDAIAKDMQHNTERR
jgi:predicted transcriptional regulator